MSDAGIECLALIGLSSLEDTVFLFVSGVAVNSYLFTFSSFFFERTPRHPTQSA